MGASPIETTDATPAGRRDWAGLALLAVPCMLVSVNSNLLNLALPALSAQLRPSTAQLLWISDIYVFLVAGLLLPMGVLADRFGRRRLLLVGAAVFAIASVGAGFAPNPGTLITCRGLIGVGAAMIAPSTLSLIRSMFRVPRQRAVALGIWTASFALGGILGPLVGGVLIEAASWRAVFAVTPPAMLVLLVLGPVLLPEYRNPRRERVDTLGVAMALVGLLATVFAIKQASAGSAPVLAIVAGAGGVLLLVFFLRRQARIANPILDVGLFSARSFTVPQVGNAIAFAVLYGTQLLLGQYLQAVLGMSPLEAGIWTIPSAVAYAVGGLLAPGLGSRFGAATVLAGGLAVSAAGFGVLAGIGTESGAVAYLIGSVIFSLGLAPVYQATTESSVAAVPTERAGVAGATLETITNLGGALGIAVFGSIAGALYRAGIARALDGKQGVDGQGVGGQNINPSGIDSQSIGDLATAAHALASDQARAVVAAGQAAFVDGFRLVVVSGAVLLLVAAIATPRLMRPAPRSRRG